MAPILQVITDTDRRGAQVFATDLDRALASMGREVRTVALAPGAVGGLECPVLGATRTGPATLHALRRAAADAVVVVAHGSTTLPACAIALAGTGTPFVYRQISDVTFWTRSWARRQRVRVALARASRVVALWAGSADTVATRFGYPRDRIVVVPNGVPAERFPPASPDEVAAARGTLGLGASATVAVYVGALVPEKGVDVAIDAVAGVSGLVLLVVGDGPERRALEAHAGAVAPGQIFYAGSLPDARPAFAAADVVVLTSRGGDSMPAVLAEAALMELPAVATAVEAIPEMVLDGRTGFVVGPEPPSARRVLERLVRDPHLRRSLGAAAREHCLQHYTMEVVARAWARVIDEVRSERSVHRGRG